MMLHTYARIIAFSICAILILIAALVAGWRG